MDDRPTWTQHQISFLSLEWRGSEIARVDPTVQRDRRIANLGMHRRDLGRRRVIYRPTAEAAQRACMAWWLRYADAINAELPRMVDALIGRRLEYPDCNPPG